jgi:hypothetical protein
LRHLQEAIQKLADELWFSVESTPISLVGHADFSEGDILVVSAVDPTIVSIVDSEGPEHFPLETPETAFTCPGYSGPSSLLNPAR